MSETLKEVDVGSKECPKCNKAAMEPVPDYDFGGPYLGFDGNGDAKFRFVCRNCNRWYSLVFAFTGDYDQIKENEYEV